MVIAVGHSYGTTVVENTFAPVIASRLAEAKPGTKIEFPVDLIVLVNTANLAHYPKQLIDAFKDRELQSISKFGKSEKPDRPIIVSIAAGTDFPNRILGPPAHGLANLTRGALLNIPSWGRGGDIRRKPYKNQPHGLTQNDFLTQTATHTPELWSHTVSITGPSGLEGRENCDDLYNCPLLSDVMEKNEPLRKEGLVNGFSVATRSGILRFTPNEAAYNNTPYWIFRIPAAARRVISGHGGKDVWSDDLYGGVIGAIIAPTLSESQRAKQESPTEPVLPFARSVYEVLQ